MTAAEYKRRRAALGHTQATLAKVLGLARGTIARRETGALPITPEAALALSALPKTKKAPGK
jgi:DNA-binding XRE family transcriptional regulator